MRHLVFQDIDGRIPAMVDDDMAADTDGPDVPLPAAKDFGGVDDLDDRVNEIKGILETDLTELILQLSGPGLKQSGIYALCIHGCSISVAPEYKNSASGNLLLVCESTFQ